MHLLNSLVNRGAKVHFESFTTFGGISSDPRAALYLTLSMQEMTSTCKSFERIVSLWNIICQISTNICKLFA